MSTNDLHEDYKKIHSICAKNDRLFTRLYYQIEEVSKAINPNILLSVIFDGEQIDMPLIIDMTHCFKLLVENNKELLEEVKKKDIYNNGLDKSSLEDSITNSFAKMSLKTLEEKLDLWLRKITKLENSIKEKHFKGVELPPFLEELQEESRKRMDEDFKRRASINLVK